MGSQRIVLRLGFLAVALAALIGGLLPAADAAQPSLRPHDGVFECLLGPRPALDPADCFPADFAARPRGDDGDSQHGCPVQGVDDHCESREAFVGDGIDYPSRIELSADQNTAYVQGSEENGLHAFGAYNAETGRRYWVTFPDLSDRLWVLDFVVTDEKIFGFGTTKGHGHKYDMVAFGLDATTGEHLWTVEYDRDDHNDTSSDLVAAPNGKSVYLVGTSEGWHTSYDVQILGLDADTGEIAWNERWGAGRKEGGTRAGLSDDGSTLYVLGNERSGSFVLSYDLVHGGDLLWKSELEYGDEHADFAYQLELDPTGESVFFGGEAHVGQAFGIAVGALESASGKMPWVETQLDARNHGWLTDVTVDRLGRQVFVTGGGSEATPGANLWSTDFVTSAFDAATGEHLWTQTYGVPGGDWEYGSSIAATERGNRVFVTGYSQAEYAAADIVTVAYDGTTGERLWVARYDGSDTNTAFNYPLLVAVGPNGARVHVAGLVRNEIAVLSYEP